MPFGVNPITGKPGPAPMKPRNGDKKQARQRINVEVRTGYRDWLDDAVPIEWLADLLKLIHDTPNLDWLLLTKRPENWHIRMAQCLDEIGKREGFPRDGSPGPFGDAMVEWLQGTAFPKNIWIGASVENQKVADERIPELLKIPAAVRFLSVEPMLGPIEFPDHLGWERCRCGARGLADCFCVPIRNLHWIIFGGESGPNTRPCNVEWIRDGVRQCRAAGVATFVKQLGANITRRWCRDCADDGPICPNDGLPCLGLRNRKGGDMSEWPEDLRVREFPEVAK